MSKQPAAPPPPVAEQAEDIQAQLVITLTASGRVSLNGPLQNKLLVYGLLEAARDAMQAFAAQQESRIVAPGGPIPNIRT